MPDNPYVGAAGSAAQGAGYGASGAAQAASSLANSLYYAAAQQKQQQANQRQATLQKALEDHIRLLNEGWQESQPYISKPVMANAPPTQQPVSVGGLDTSVPWPNMTDTGLKTRTPNPEQSDPTRVVELGDGRRMYKPTTAQTEAAKLNDSNSFVAPPGTPLEASFQKELGIAPGTRIPFTHIPAMMDVHKSLNPEPDTQEVNWNGVDQNGNPSPFAINRKTLKTSPVTPPPGTTLPGKPAKEPRRETAEDWERIITDPDSSPAEVQRATAARNLHRQPTPEQNEADADRHLRAQELKQARDTEKATTIRATVKQKYDRMEKARQTFSEGLPTPEAANALKAEYQQAQKEYEETIKSVNGNDPGHDPWPDQVDPNALLKTHPLGGLSGPDSKSAPKPAQKPATQAQSATAAVQPAQKREPAGPPKLAGLDQVRVYAKKKGIKEADAIREFKSAGYSIGQ